MAIFLPKMSISPSLRLRLWTVVAALTAVALGYLVAEESMFASPLLGLAFVVILGALGALILSRVQSQPIGTFLLGLILVGYIVANRGFAQISLAGRIPLFPAEFVLLVTASRS